MFSLGHWVKAVYAYVFWYVGVCMCLYVYGCVFVYMYAFVLMCVFEKLCICMCMLERRAGSRIKKQGNFLISWKNAIVYLVLSAMESRVSDCQQSAVDTPTPPRFSFPNVWHTFRRRSEQGFRGRQAHHSAPSVPGPAQCVTGTWRKR